MKYLILLNILKLIHKFVPIKILEKKINIFFLVQAKRIVTKLSEARKKNLPPIKIKNIFLTSGIDLRVKDDNFYYKLSNFITGYDDSKKNKIYLISQIENQISDYVTFNAWLRLRDIFYLRSKFILGGICRKKSVESALKSKVSFFLSKKDKARSRLDKALNIENINDYLNEHSLNYNFDKKLFKKYLFSVHKIKYKNLNSNLSENEKNLFKLLENKTLAIVGPVNTKYNDGSEIDSYDLVLRFNHIGLNKILDIYKKGSRTDITYFNGDIANDIANKKLEKIDILHNQLKAVVVKFNSLNKLKNLQLVNKNLIIKETNNYNFLSFYSSLNMLPLTLLDLLESGVKKIKIFHSDLYLSKKDPNYLAYRNSNTEDKIKERDLKSLIKHDPMSQHELLKKLYEHPKITGDENFDKIMRLNTYEYLEKLEDCYN